MFGKPVSVVNPDESATTICRSAGTQLFVDFSLKLGNLEPVSVSFNDLENDDMIIFGNGEKHQGTVNGISPIMWNFRLTHGGAMTILICLDASAEEVKVALENLPSIGLLTMIKNIVRHCLGTDGQNIYPGTFINFCELHCMCRNRVRLHYLLGSYQGSPLSLTAYALAWQQPFRDVPDLLWLACVGVMDRYLHGRLNLAGYLALSVDLQWLVGRLFPNDAVNKAGRAVFSKELESYV